MRDFWGEELRCQALSLGLGTRRERKKSRRKGKRNNWKEKRRKRKETVGKWGNVFQRRKRAA